MFEKMVRLILVRHGESIANKEGIYQGQTYDTGLTKRGVKQARASAKTLAKMKIDKIISSPLRRTKDSAEIIGRQLKTPVLVEHRIIEISHGEWEGKHKEWVKKSYPDLLETWKEKPTEAQMPNGENMEKVSKRINKFLQAVRKNYDGKNILVVGHDLIMRTMIANLLGLSLDHIWNFQLDNGGITILELGRERTSRLVVLNQSIHLKNLISRVDGQAL